MKSVDTADLKSADSKKSCRFDSGLGHQVLMKSKSLLHSFLIRLGFTGLAIFAISSSAETLSFHCTHTDRDISEDYVLKVISPVDGAQAVKGKVYFDERDLDRLGTDGRQEVKNVVITKEKVSFLIDTSFPPEEFDGVRYGAGTAVSLITITRATGELKKTETIRGGFLASTLGEGTKTYIEKCAPLKGG